MRKFPGVLFIAAALMLLMSAGTTNAALQAVGPTNPVTTLPEWYQDAFGLALAPCVDQTPFCSLPPEFTPPGGTLVVLDGAPPISDLNWPNLAFYFLADSQMDVGPSLKERAVLRLSLEANFVAAAPPIVVPGQGTTVLKIDLKQMKKLTPDSTYTVTHPYGTFQFTTDGAGDTIPGGGQAFRTQDPAAPTAGVYFPVDLQNATTTHIDTFLVRVGGPVTDPATGNSYVANPGIDTAVTGSPTGNNVFRIDGPDIGGTGINTIETPLFRLTGKIVGFQVTSPAEGNDYGAWQVGTSAPAKSYTVTNLTSAPITPTLASSNAAEFVIAPGTCGVPVAVGGTCTFDVTFTPAADGAKSSTISASTPTVPPATVSVTGIGDSTPPTLTITPVIPFTPLSVQTISGTVTDTNAVASVQVSVNGVSQGTATITPGTPSTWSKQVTLANANAANGISVTATDTAQPTGNVSTPQTATITTDTINPVVGISSPAAGLTNNATPPLTFTATDANGIATTLVQLDNTTLPFVPATLGPLADGPHTVTIDVTDPAGNHNTPIASATFTVDTTQPVIAITSPAAGTISTAAPILTFSVTDINADPTKTVVRLDGNVIPVTSGSTLGSFAPGVSHTVTVDATDLAGNIATTGSVTFMVNLGPALTVTPATKPFGSLAVNLPSAPTTFTISNNGNSGLPLTITSITLTGADTASFPLNFGSCGLPPFNLAVGGSCNFSVRFAPIATGAKSATIEVAATAETTASRPLTGTGVAATSFPVMRTLPTQANYATLSEAFTAATGNANLLAMNAILPASGLTVNSTGTVNFSGGYDALWVNRTGTTAMQGVMTVQQGGLVVDSLIIM